MQIIFFISSKPVGGCDKKNILDSSRGTHTANSIPLPVSRYSNTLTKTVNECLAESNADQNYEVYYRYSL